MRNDVRHGAFHRAVLQRADPADPAHPDDRTKFVCDLCTETPTPTDNGTTYTFKIARA